MEAVHHHRRRAQAGSGPPSSPSRSPRRGARDFLADLARPRKAAACGRARPRMGPRQVRSKGRSTQQQLGQQERRAGRDEGHDGRRGTGVITHIWVTFLGPEPHAWARGGSADHQDMLLRITMTATSGRRRGPLGDFFANCFGSGARS